MWQSPPCKLGQPYADTCHNPPFTKMTNQILPCHHLTHETLTLIFIISFHHHGSRRRQSHRQTSGHHSSTIFLLAGHHSRSSTSIALHHAGNRAPFAHPTYTRSATLGHHFTLLETQIYTTDAFRELLQQHTIHFAPVTKQYLHHHAIVNDATVATRGEEKLCHHSHRTCNAQQQRVSSSSP